MITSPFLLFWGKHHGKNSNKSMFVFLLLATVMAHRVSYCLANDPSAISTTNTVTIGSSSAPDSTSSSSLSTRSTRRELQSKNSVQSKVRDNVAILNQNIETRARNFVAIHGYYSSDRQIVIRKRAAIADYLLTHYGDHAQFGSLVKQLAEEMRRIAVIVVNHHVSQLSLVIASLYQQKEWLDDQKTTINDFVRSTSYGLHNFKTEFDLINKALAAAQKIIDSVKTYRRKLESTVYGTMCFDVIGAEGKITTNAEQAEFQELTRDVIEIACGELGVDADLVLMKIIKQQFIMRRRRLNEPHAEAKKGDERDLGLKEAILRVATVIGIDCNCDDVDPISDVWSRNLLEMEETEEDEKTFDDELLMALDNITIAGARSIPLQLDRDDDFPETIESLFLFHDHDENDSVDDDVVGDGTNRPFLSPDQAFHRDALYEEDRQLLETTALERSYLQALQDAFNSLQKVVEVKQISCAGFLSDAEAWAYLNKVIL